MDGQDVSGSEFELKTSMSNAPDARGKFLRMSNNGHSTDDTNPDNSALGSYQEESFKSHAHEIGVNGTDTYSMAVNGATQRLAHFKNDQYGSGSAKKTHSVGGNETRPKNITVNFYLKINKCSPNSAVCK